MVATKFIEELSKQTTPSIIVKKLSRQKDVTVYRVFNCTLQGHATILVFTENEFNRYATVINDFLDEPNIVHKTSKGNYHVELFVANVKYHIRIPPTTYGSRVSYRIHSILEDLEKPSDEVTVRLLTNIVQHNMIIKNNLRCVVGYEPMSNGNYQRHYYLVTNPEVSIMELDVENPILTTHCLVKSFKELMARVVWRSIFVKEDIVRKESSFIHEVIIKILTLLPIKAAL